MGTKKYVVVDDKLINISVQNHQIIKIDKEKITPEIVKLSRAEYIIKLKDKSFRGEVVRLKQNSCTIAINGNTYHFTIETEKSYKRSKKLENTGTEALVKLTAPLPGAICEVSVELNQIVQKGDALFTLEAMKMQNEITAPVNGRITQLSVKESDIVFKDQVLIEIDTRT